MQLEAKIDRNSAKNGLRSQQTAKATTTTTQISPDRRLSNVVNAVTARPTYSGFHSQFLAKITRHLAMTHCRRQLAWFLVRVTRRVLCSVSFQLQPRLGSSSLPIFGAHFSQPARISKRFSGHRAAHSTVRVEVRQHSPWDAILSICSGALTNLLQALNDMLFYCYINAILVAVLMCSLGNLDTFLPQCVWKFHWKAISVKYLIYLRYILGLVYVELYQKLNTKCQFIEVFISIKKQTY